MESVGRKRGTRLHGAVTGRTLGRWTLVALWMAWIFFLSSQASLPLPGVNWIDDLLRIAGHFVEYAVLAFLVSRAMASPETRSRRWIALALILCAAYAVSDEWHQSFVPGRDASVFDLFVDTAGAALGTVVFARRSNRARPD